MQVSVETTQGLERKMTVQVPAERINDAVESRLKAMSKTARMDGFRPGKVPMSVLRKRFAPQVRMEAIGQLMQDSYFDAVEKESLRPAGMPRFEPISIDGDEHIEFAAYFEVYPEVKLGDLSKLKIERPTAEVTDADVEKMIETLRNQRSTWEAVKRKSKKGDRAVIDFVGTIDGVEFAGGKGTGMPVDLGKGNMLKDFEAGIIGMKAGEEKEVEVSFPEDYHGKEVAGKTAVFKITCQSVSESKPAELNDDFVKAFGIEGGVDKLNEEVRANMQRELKQGIANNVKKQVMDQLLANNEVEVPKAVLVDEQRRLRDSMVQQMGRGASADSIPMELFAEEAARRVKLGLLIAEFIRENDVKADGERLKEKLEDIASGYESPEEVKDYYKKNREMMSGLENLVIEEQVVDMILEKAKVTDKASSFDEVMNKAR